MGGDPIAAVHKLGADRIYHVHAKDVRVERNYMGADGCLDTKTIDQFAKRTWNYVAFGHGHDVSWWKEFFSCLSMEGLRRNGQPGDGGSDDAAADRPEKIDRRPEGSITDGF
jgi:sugar phosphate isomerase/epimerase